MKRILLSPDPAEGGELTEAKADELEAKHFPPSPSPAPAPPPAAEIVQNSDASPGDAGELVRLKRELDDERKARKGVETRAAELEDSLHRLTTPPSPAPAKRVKTTFPTLFHEE